MLSNFRVSKANYGTKCVVNKWSKGSPPCEVYKYKDKRFVKEDNILKQQHTNICTEIIKYLIKW